MILKVAGDTTGSRAMYETIMKSSGGANAAVYFRAALLAAQSGDIRECEEIINRAAVSGFSLSGEDYYKLGAAVGNIPGHEKTAVKYLKMSLGPAQSSEKAWLAIADIYSRSGNREPEADIYVNLFRSNMNAHSGRLKTAGQIYDTLGLIDKAQEAYTLFWEKGFVDYDVSVSLARILVSQQECTNLWDVLSLHPVTPEVAQLLGECGLRRAVTAVRMEEKKMHPALLTMRISGGALAALGFAGGLYQDSKVREEARRYNDFGSPMYPKGTDAEYYAKVKEMRKNIDNAVLGRNLLYFMAGMGAGAFTVSFLF
jgi:tetratricopeptide (TPR) repeat protein